MKEPKCTICSGKHYKTFCPKALKKPISKVSKKKTVAKKVKTKTRSQLVKELDKVYSIYIRNKYADKDGLVQCVTCGERKPVKEMQNGHYESRGHYPTRWLDKNCHPQCPACNVFKKGNYTEYAIYMVHRYGVGVLEELKILANSGEKISTVWIKEQIEYYKNLK